MNCTHAYFINDTSKVHQVANRDRGGKINEKAQVWLGHFISCLFQALGHFIEHLVCIGGTKSKPTTPF